MLNGEFQGDEVKDANALFSALKRHVMAEYLRTIQRGDKAILQDAKRSERQSIAFGSGCLQPAGSVVFAAP
jgi:hypothetical protein